MAERCGCVVEDELHAGAGRGIHCLGEAVVGAPLPGGIEFGNEVRDMMDAPVSGEQSAVVAEQFDH